MHVLTPRPPPPRPSLASAIEAANAGLDAKGGAALDERRLRRPTNEQERYEQRHTSVADGMELNLTLLDADTRARFAELGVFPEDVDVPIGLAARLWAETGNLDRHDTEALLAACDDASLLLDLDFTRVTFRFHDSVREYLHDAAGKHGLIAHHKRLIQAMGDMGSAVETPAADGDYFYRYLPQHLAEAEDREALDTLLLDPAWLHGKLATTKSPLALVADYEQHGISRMHNLIGRTLRLTAGICARDGRQLMPQLLGRLIDRADPAALRFLERARRHLTLPAILTERPSLTPPSGAETARLEGHTATVQALAVLPDGRLASGAHDGTIALWNRNTGAESARLEGHTGGVSALKVLPDGRLASAGNDNTIRLWDLGTGAEAARLEGHTGGVQALVVLPDGRLASGSEDRTIRLWNLGTGAEVACLEDHTGGVQALVVLPDGRLASGGYDNTIRLWDPKAGAEPVRFKGHTGWVRALAVLPDGRLASGSGDAIYLWDPDTGTDTARLWDFGVHALAVLPDGRLASGAPDGTIRLWDPVDEYETARLEGHTGGVHALAVLPDGRLASGGGGDNMIRLWDLKTGAEGAPGLVWALAVLPDGRLASAGYDSTIRLWDPKAGAEPVRFKGHTGWVCPGGATRWPPRLRRRHDPTVGPTLAPRPAAWRATRAGCGRWRCCQMAS